MPLQNALPTWLALNNMNSTSPSGMTDPNTGFPYEGGGLNVGDYFDLNNEETANASYTTNGVLYNGRYRYVQVDSGANTSYVKTGLVGYIRGGGMSGTVKTVVALTQGSGQTLGTYQVSGVGGGGTGAVIQVVVTASNAITVSVLNGGYGYNSAPTFTLSTGGTPGTVAAQLDSSPNIVTSADQVAGGTAVPVRPVVFLNAITPGNYGFIQELGLATVQATGSVGTTSLAALVDATPSNNGSVVTRAAAGSPIGYTIGQAVDVPANSILFKTLLQYVPVVQD